MHYDPLTTHAPVASGSSPMVLFSTTVHHNLHLKQMNVKTAFLNLTFEHEVWVGFLVGYDHPSREIFALQHTSLDVLKQATCDWYALQHV